MESTNSNAAAIRAFRILTVVSDHDEGCGLVEIAQALDLPKQTVHRLIKQLELYGLLVLLPCSKRLFLGRPVHQLAIRSLTHGPSRQVRHGILKALVDEIGETCNLTALVDSDVLYLDRVETHWPLRANLGPGSHVPIHATASGKLLLGYLPRRKRDQLISNLPLRALTPHTITKVDDLLREVEAARKQGYAVNAQEHLMGMVALAVPVFHQGVACAAIATQAPIGRMTMEDLVRVLPSMKAAALAMGDALNV
ncbi:MAG: IclR family transcriptional regulator [bacterium]